MFGRRYEKLLIWRRSMDLVACVYQMTQAFPETEKSGLTAAIKKSVSGLPGSVLEAAGAIDTGDPDDADRSLAKAQRILVDLYSHALIAKRVGVMKRRPLAQLRRRCKKLDQLLERDRQAIAPAPAPGSAPGSTPGSAPGNISGSAPAPGSPPKNGSRTTERPSQKTPDRHAAPTATAPRRRSTMRIRPAA